MAIHGNKSQSQRTHALQAFRSGDIKLLVATDIAARGIDVENVSHVVNFELPNIPESYVHRIGRTARAGKTGVAVSLCDGAEREYLRDIEKLVGYKISSTGDGGAGDEPEPRRGGRNGNRHGNGNRQPRNGAPKNARSGNRPPRRNKHKAKPAAQGERAEARPGNEGDGDGLARMLGQKPGGNRPRPGGARRSSRKRNQGGRSENRQPVTA